MAFPLYLWEPFDDLEAARFLSEWKEKRGMLRAWKNLTCREATGGVPYFFWWDVVRRVHRKAPTTTKMMVKAPTATMMTITRMWFSLVPDLPEERRETGLDWKRSCPSMLTDICSCVYLMAAMPQNLKGSHQLQLKGLEGTGFQKVLALVEDLRLFRIEKTNKQKKPPLSSFLTCGHINSVK